MGLPCKLRLCCSLLALCFVVRADFSVQTTGPGDSYNGAQFTNIFVSTFDPSQVAIAARFYLPSDGVYATALHVPFFETEGTPARDTSFSIVSGTAAQPNLADTFATFALPAGDWPHNTVPFPRSSLSSVDSTQSDLFTGLGPYWLVMQTSGALGSVDAYWEVSATKKEPWVSGVIGSLGAGSDYSPAYRIDFSTTDPHPVPEPGAAGLLAFAGAAGLLRRRRRAA